MAAFNRCIFFGNLTRDPEVRYVKNGESTVCTFTLAVNHRGGQGDETLFLDVVAWNKLAEVASQYLVKGGTALVEGRLVIRKYDTKDGEKRTATELVASDIRFLGGKGASSPTPVVENEVSDEELVPF
jgi:single-strand DNA-binding protein